jgi:hypothetical protein
VSVAFERIAAAMGSMCEQEERVVNDELAPVLRDEPNVCGDQMHRLAHATLDELASFSSGGRPLCGVVAYALSVGLLLGYQLGQSDALERSVSS